MSFTHGKSTVVLMSGYNMSNYLKSIEVSKTADTAETTVFNSSNAKSYIAGKVDATLSGDGLFDGANIDSTLRTALGSSNSKVWTYWPEGTSTGSAGYGMDAFQTTYDMNSPIEDVVSLSIESQSKMGMDRIVSLFSLQSISSSSGNGNNNDNSALSTVGGVGYIQRTDTGGGTIASAIIQQSSAASSWSTLISFSAVSAQTGQRVATNSTAVKRYTRFKYTLSGTTVAATFNVGFYRK